MLEPLIGSLNRERVLLYLLTREQGYAREIARFFDTNLTPIQKQLKKLEIGGVLVKQNIGRTKMYQFNPRYPFLSELKTLLSKALSFYPDEEIEEFTMNRRRPVQE